MAAVRSTIAGWMTAILLGTVGWMVIAGWPSIVGWLLIAGLLATAGWFAIVGLRSLVGSRMAFHWDANSHHPGCRCFSCLVFADPMTGSNPAVHLETAVLLMSPSFAFRGFLGLAMPSSVPHSGSGRHCRSLVPHLET